MESFLVVDCGCVESANESESALNGLNNSRGGSHSRMNRVLGRYVTLLMYLDAPAERGQAKSIWYCALRIAAEYLSLLAGTFLSSLMRFPRWCAPIGDS